MSKHSNEKPIEPEKPAPVEVEDTPAIEIREPVKPSSLTRPSVDTELTTIQPTVAPALKQSIDNLALDKSKPVTPKSGYGNFV